MNVDRKKILEVAASYDGYKEDPPNSNLTLFGKWYGADGEPWCAMDVCKVFDEAGFPFPHIQNEHGAAYVPYIYDFYKKWSTPENSKFTDTPQPGDVVIYDWNGDGKGDHIGIYTGWVITGKSFHAWEGNTSPTSDSNGGQHMLRLRYMSQVLCFINADKIV